VVTPADIPPGRIEVRLGTHWIPGSDVNQFLLDVLDAEELRWSHSSNQFVRYVAQTAEWVMEVQPIVPAARNFGHLKKGAVSELVRTPFRKPLRGPSSAPR